MNIKKILSISNNFQSPFTTAIRKANEEKEKEK